MREGKLPLSLQEKADNELRLICLEDGMSRFRAWYVHRAVREFGAYSCRPAVKKVIVAP